MASHSFAMPETKCARAVSPPQTPLARSYIPSRIHPPHIPPKESLRTIPPVTLLVLPCSPPLTSPYSIANIYFLALVIFQRACLPPPTRTA